MSEYNIRGYNIKITGFVTEINDPRKIIGLIQDINSQCNHGNCTIQLLHARGVAGKKHILQAISQALKAFDSGTNISKDLGLEICVRTSFQRQISKALKILGIERGKIGVCLVAVDCDNQAINKIGEVLGKEDEGVFQADINALKDIYKITDDEINAAGDIERVMIEKTALLSLEI